MVYYTIILDIERSLTRRNRFCFSYDTKNVHQYSDWAIATAGFCKRRTAERAEEPHVQPWDSIGPDYMILKIA